MKTKRIKNKFVSVSFLMLLLLGIFATLLPQTVYATTIFGDGFESGDYSAWTGTVVSTGATLEVSTAQKHHGNYSSRSITLYGSNDAYSYKTFTSVITTYLRFYFYAVNITLSSGDYACLSSLGDAYDIGVGAGVFNSEGVNKIAMFWRDVSGGDRAVSATNFPATGEWHCFEVMRTRDATNGEFRLWLDGVEIEDVRQTGKNTTNMEVDRVRAGHFNPWYSSGSQVETYIDCVVVADTYIGPEIANTAPTIGEFQAPATVYANIPFLLNVTINDLDSVTDFVNATIEISGSLPSKCKWENATDTFTEYEDPENYIILHADGSVKTQLNTTANKLTFNLTVKWEHPEGYVNITATVTDKFGANATLNVTNAFKFQHFSTPEQYNLNEQLKNEGKPHVTNSSQLITSLSYTPTKLTLTVNVPPKATSTTTIKGIGAIPQNVYIDGLTAQLFSTKAEFDTYNGKCWYYDSQNDLIYTKTTGSLIEILWQGYTPTPTPSPAPAPTPPTPTFDLKITRIPAVIYTLWQNQFTAEIQIANPTLLSTDVTLQWQLLDPQMQIIAYGQQIIYAPAQTNTTTTITIPTTFLAHGTYTLKTQITNPAVTDPTIMTIQLTPIPLQQTIMVTLVIAIVAVAYLTLKLKRKP